MCVNLQGSEYISGPKNAKILLYERYTAFWIWQDMLWQSMELIVPWAECLIYLGFSENILYVIT